jgi:hypothetical protein
VAAEKDYGYPDYFLLMCGRREDMLRAKENYESFGLRHGSTMLLNDAQGRRYGALLFDANGSTAESLTTLRAVCQQPHLEFWTIWDTFAKMTLRAYRFVGSPLKGADVIETHRAYLGLGAEAFTQSTCDALGQAICSQPLEGRYKISYIDQQLVLSADGEKIRTIPARIDIRGLTPILATVIGQVNPAISLDQILVDARTYQSWLLNYVSLVPNAPLLAPFAILELDVKQEMLATAQVSLDERYHLEETLAYASNLYTTLDSETYTPGVRRTLRAIQSIRRSAGERLQVEHMAVYQTSLLFAALAKLSRFRSLDQLSMQKQQAFHAQMLIGAALIFNGLQPSEPVREGLWIDRAQRKLWRDDRWISLAPGDYDLVEFLARTPGEVCSYWSIICTLIQPGLKDFESDLRSKGLDDLEIGRRRQQIIQSYRNTIDPKVFRIRNAIADEAPFRFLVNNRGNGFRLMLAGALES